MAPTNSIAFQAKLAHALMLWEHCHLDFQPPPPPPQPVFLQAELSQVELNEVGVIPVHDLLLWSISFFEYSENVLRNGFMKVQACMCESVLVHVTYIAALSCPNIHAEVQFE